MLGNSPRGSAIERLNVASSSTLDKAACCSGCHPVVHRHQRHLHTHRSTCLRDETSSCKHSLKVADVYDARAIEAVLSLARTTSAPVAVLTEGRLLYFTESKLARLAEQLFSEPQVA